MKQSKKLWLLFTALFGLAVSSTQSTYAQEVLVPETTLVSQVVEEVEETSFEEVVSTPDETEETSLEETSQIVEETTTETKEENAPPVVEETTTETSEETTTSSQSESTESSEETNSETQRLEARLFSSMSENGIAKLNEEEVALLSQNSPSFASLRSAIASNNGSLSTGAFLGRIYYSHGGVSYWDDMYVMLINGEYVFCIEPLTTWTPGTYYQSTELGDQNHSLSNKAITYDGRYLGASPYTLTVDLQQKLERIVKFSFHDNISSLDLATRYKFTNFMIWEQIGVQGLPQGGGYAEHKNRVLTAVQNYHNVPSFNVVAGKEGYKDVTHDIRVGQTLNFTDEWDILGKLDIPTNLSGYTLSVNGNVLSITATDKSETTELRFITNSDVQSEGTSFIYRAGESRQTLGSFRLSDPYFGALRLNLLPLDPTIETTATNKEDGLKVVDPLTTVTITDAVKYTDLIVGKEYEIKGILMDKSTNKPLLVEGKEIVSTLKFVAEESNGVKNLDFTFNASALAGREVVVFEDLLRDGLLLTSHADINDLGQTVRVTEPKVGTTATNKEDGLKVVDPLTTITITDAVKYTDLIVGKEYEIKGILMDKSTNKPLLVEGKEIVSTLKFVAEETNGVKNLDFTFNASALAGREVVVFEDLLRDGLLLTSHADINDLGQTVRVTEPKVGTTATNKEDGLKVFDPLTTITITDAVKYTDLIVGKEYEIKGILMDKSTNKPLLVEGKEIVSTLKFVAEESNGVKNLDFTFNASALAGREVVVFEDLLRDGLLLTSHADINDLGQTVRVTEPKIGTQASNANTGGNVISPNQTAKIKDVVKYTDLIVGKEYEVKGILMDKETQKALLVDGKEVTSTLKFVADKTEGEVELEFTFNATGLHGKELVVFENVYRENNLVAVHADINDKAQTVSVANPTIGTLAHVDGEKVITIGEKVIITDEVKYSGLVVGEKYYVTGWLMDKATNQPLLIDGKEVTAKSEVFVAESSEGTITMEFEVDTKTLGGKDIVVFEELYHEDGTLVAEHKDINDEGQTVKFVYPPSPEIPTVPGQPTLPNTGESSSSIQFIAVLFLVLGLFFMFAFQHADNKQK